MKKTKLMNITMIGTIFFFTACSNSEPKVKNTSKKSNISVYNIIGISEEDKENLNFMVEDKGYTEPSNTIEYISYQENNLPKEEVANNIQFISYKKKDSTLKKTRNKIEWIAKSFLGTPYVWGATGPSKFDCSGFTQWVYRDVGIKIPRVSRDQARVGQYISYSNLQPGDMVFFDTKKHRSGKVTHVGIYLGRGNFIHASSAGKKVVIYNFNKKEYYKKRFLWGRRVTTNQSIYASN